jgi:alpha-ribazole phosphatase
MTAADARAKILWAARHPPVSAPGICYGRTDVGLVASAEDAANTLEASFTGASSIVWSSPSTRCVAVAELLARRRAVELRVDTRLSELDFGMWEGRTWAAIEREEPQAFTHWMENWKSAAPPGGESVDALTIRVGGWLAELREDARAAAHAPMLITHAGVIRALLVRIDGLGWDVAMKRNVPHLAWTRFVP